MSCESFLIHANLVSRFSTFMFKRMQTTIDMCVTQIISNTKPPAYLLQNSTQNRNYGCP
ncbi:hypothetical protein GYH30_029360 [Glycine max]|uniref:Uncharacterized protein n=1 Tax=Glycine max TaxID=3847 RepID=A0A0R0I7F8_SOYBN|nr:hypothetical protein GYH30_029360 [Glycine max]